MDCWLEGREGLEHMNITERLREIATRLRRPRDGRPWGADDAAADMLDAIAAELEAAPAGAHAEPVGNADMPVVAYECTEGIEQERLLRWSLPAGEFVGGKEPLIRQRDALAAIASRDERIAGLEDALQKSGESVVRFSDAWTEAQRRVIELEADLREEQDRRQAMRTEWGAEVAALNATLAERQRLYVDYVQDANKTVNEIRDHAVALAVQARHAEDCLDAAASRIVTLLAELRVSRLRARSSESLAGIVSHEPAPTDEDRARMGWTDGKPSGEA